VDLRVPFMLTTAARYRVAGETAHLSLRGTAGKLDVPARFTPGSPVMLSLDGPESRCDIPALVVQSHGRHQHFFFPSLTLGQERYLVNLVYSRPEAWVYWHRSRPADHALSSLARILLLSLRGMVIVLVGFFTSRPADRGEPRRQKKGGREPALAASILCAGLLALTTPAKCYGSDPPASAAAGTTVTQPAPFHDEYELGGGSTQETFPLKAAGASQNFFFGVPVTKVVSAATLRLHYAAPVLQVNESRLELNLNGTSIGTVALTPGSDLQSEIVLPTDLLTTDNTLIFQLQGACQACTRSHSAWVTIDAHSVVTFTGTKLALPNDLALLPIPFFDAAGQRPWSLPVVFAERPDADTLQAASIVASWFGIFSDFRGVRFPVSLGELPEGNAVLLTLRRSALAASLSLPSQPGPLIAIRDNPHDPYGKILILAGDRA
jgi:cellulose synthase (UDP-forming)